MFLDKYIKENGKLTDYGVFKEDGISGIVTIPVSDLFLAQFKNIWPLKIIMDVIIMDLIYIIKCKECVLKKIGKRDLKI